MITIPNTFGAELRRVFPEHAPQWLAELPAIVDRRLTEWSLTPTGTVHHGMVGVVLEVHRPDGTPAALKIPYPDEESATEWLGLATWKGNGAAELYAHHESDNAMLLELLDAESELSDEPLEVALDESARLLRTLAVPAPPGLRRLEEMTARTEAELLGEWERLGAPLPREQLDSARACCRVLGPAAGNRMVNEDLHFENVLRGRDERSGEWLVVDPKPIEGDPEFAIIPLLWNRFDELPCARVFDRIVEHAELDVERAIGWTFIRAVENALWEQSVGDPEAARVCAAIAEMLLPRLPAAFR